MVMQCQVSEMIWEMESNSVLERLLALTDVCMEYLVIITSFVGEEAGEDFTCIRNGALARDGCIYTLTDDGQVLKI